VTTQPAPATIVRRPPDLRTRSEGRNELALYAALTALVLALALVRIPLGPWYHTYSPWIGRLLDGMPVEWESDYYLVHLPTFVGDGLPMAGFSLVHRRVFLELWASAALAAWTGSAFWGIAVVELAGWILAAIATYHLGRRLSIAAWPSALAAVLVAGSPLLVSNMWMHVFHVAEFATLPAGMWAGLVLLQPALRPGAVPSRTVTVQGAGIGVLLLVLSLTYQYQWVVAPLLVIAALTAGGLSRAIRCRGLLAISAGVVTYLAAAQAFRMVLDLAFPVRTDDMYAQAVSQPTQLLLAQVRAATTPLDLLASLQLVITAIKMVGTYHPVVFVIGIAGMAFVPAQTRWLTAGALLLTLVATTLYSTAWTAMTAYPFVYLGAGAACAAARRRPLSVGLVVVLLALTNRDLWGDPTFLKEWWGYYSGRNLF
jgi:hypothetical protein